MECGSNYKVSYLVDYFSNTPNHIHVKYVASTFTWALVNRGQDMVFLFIQMKHSLFCNLSEKTGKRTFES